MTLFVADAQDGRAHEQRYFGHHLRRAQECKSFGMPPAPYGTFLTVNNGPLAGVYYAADSNFAPPLHCSYNCILGYRDNSGDPTMVVIL